MSLWDWLVIVSVPAIWRLFGWLENRERRAIRRLEAAVDERERYI